MWNNKKEWISFANVLSCIAVVFLHTNGCFWTYSTENYWFTANIIESVFYFAVPCFFMISGATLMDYSERYSLKVFFVKRAKKTLIPYIAWSTIGIIYAIALGNIKYSDVTPGYLWDAFINAKAVSIYWFFPVLFGLYMTIPLFAAVEKSKRKDIYTFASLALFVTVGIIPFVLEIAGKSVMWNSALNIQIGGYTIYLLIGYLIFEYEINSFLRHVVYLLAISGLVLHICGTYILSVGAGEIVDTYKGYINAPCILYSSGVFVWCKYNAKKLLGIGFVKKLVNTVSPYTLSIYLIQFFIYTTGIRFLKIDTTALVYRLVAPIIIILAAMLIAHIIRKIPVLRAIVP